MADLPQKWNDFFQERAAIRQFDGGQIKYRAEREAFIETTNAMADERANLWNEYTKKTPCEASANMASSLRINHEVQK